MTTVFFDLDNTLTDRTKTVNAYAHVFLNGFVDELKPNLDVSEIGMVLNELDAGGYGGHENRSKALLELPIWRQLVSTADLVEHWQGWVPSNSLPMDGLYSCLDELKSDGYDLALVTNGSRKAQRGKILVLNLEPYFDVCIVSEEVGIKKPDAGIFRCAVDAMNCTADQSIFVGDHPVNDYQGSKEFGMTPIWFEGSHDWPHSEPAQYSVSNLAELRPVIRSILRA